MCHLFYPSHLYLHCYWFWVPGWLTAEVVDANIYTELLLIKILITVTWPRWHFLHYSNTVIKNMNVSFYTSMLVSFNDLTIGWQTLNLLSHPNVWYPGKIIGINIIKRFKSEQNICQNSLWLRVLIVHMSYCDYINQQSEEDIRLQLVYHQIKILFRNQQH